MSLWCDQPDRIVTAMRSPAFLLRQLVAVSSRMRSDERGNILVLFALALLPMLTLVGVLIDTSRTQNAKIDLQNAVDAGVLAAAKLNDADNTRVATAERYFRGALPPNFPGTVDIPRFAITTGSVSVTGHATAKVNTSFGGLLGKSTIDVGADATALIAKPQVRHLDLVFCIDATGSMQNTINAVKNTALTFESSLNTELQNRKIDKFDSMRVKVVFYRDYGGNAVPQREQVWDSKLKKYVWVEPDMRDVGDKPVMKMGGFWPLPAQSTSFSTFVSAEKASGGGDLPESGLECVNEGMNSAWIKQGETVVGGTSAGKKITASFNVIVVWTDADAQKPSYERSLLNPDYPPATVMPRKWVATAPEVGLTGKWLTATTMDHNNQMLVFFGDEQKSNWKPVAAWPNFFKGGTLTQGNTELVVKLANAIATKTKTPTLTQ